MDKYMKFAIAEAKKSAKEGGIPIGAVLVKDNKLISSGHNKRVQLDNQILHGEIDCLSNAGRIKDFKNTVMYSTLMPCYMCAGAIVQFKIPKIYVGENENYDGAYDFLKKHNVEVVVLDQKECKQMLSDFISKHRDIWFEDIGENE